MPADHRAGTRAGRAAQRPVALERRPQRRLGRQEAPAVGGVAVRRPREAGQRVALLLRPFRLGGRPRHGDRRLLGLGAELDVRVGHVARSGEHEDGGAPRRAARGPRGRGAAAAGASEDGPATSPRRVPRREDASGERRARSASGRPPAVAALAARRPCTSSAARCATCCSARRRTSSTSSSRATRSPSRAGPRAAGGRVTVHERFGTATVPPATTLDLAAARRRALPAAGRAARGRARRDAARRTCAGATSPSTRSPCAWPTGERSRLPGRCGGPRGRRACASCTTARSVDDPTRLLRLARYAARLGFEPEPSTAALAREAIAGGALATVTGPRLGAELRLLLREPQPRRLLALERHGLGRALLGPASRVDPARDAGAQRAAPPDGRARPRRPRPRRSRGRAWRAGASTSSPSRRASGTRRGRAPPRLAPALARRRRGRLRRRRRAEPAEALAVAAALGAAEAARRWLDGVRHVPPGDHRRRPARRRPRAARPWGAALARRPTAMLDGEAPDRDAQLAAALRRRA